MRIEQIPEDPQAYLYMENLVNQGTRNYTIHAENTEVMEVYRPGASLSGFNLPYIWLPTNQVKVLLNEPSDYLAHQFVDADHVPFYIHPQLFNEGYDGVPEMKQNWHGEHLNVVQTASTRTVLAPGQPEIPEYFIKLHLPAMIQRFRRGLDSNSINHSIDISTDIKNVRTNSRFGYMPESVGVIGPNNWGYILRELPNSVLSGDRFLIPTFSLYAGDAKKTEDLPLLVQLIDILGKNPVDFTMQNIITPIIEGWCAMASQRGILHGSHGQNTLLEIDAKFSPTRVIFRDFDTIVDPEIRSSFIPSENALPMDQLYSAVYDYLVGDHLFDYLARVLNSFYGVNTQKMNDEAKDIFVQNFPDKNKFPETMFYYQDKLYPQGRYELYDTGLKPNWR